MATPRIGQQAVLNGKPVIWSGNHGWQSPASHKKLQEQGKFRFGTQFLDRVGNSIVNNPVVKRLEKARQDFNQATAWADPLVNAAKGVENSNVRLPSQIPGEGAAIAANAITRRLNIDPRLALIGMVGLNAGGILKGPRARTSKPGIGLDDVGSKPQFTGQSPRLPKRQLPAPKPSTGGQVTGSTAEVVRDAFGPGQKQFGAYPRETALQRAHADGLTPVGKPTGTQGRPSAKASSPALRDLSEGVRRSTGQQRIRDRLNQTRTGETPVQGSPAPKPPTQPRLTPQQKQQLAREKARAEVRDRRALVEDLKNKTRPVPSSKDTSPLPQPHRQGPDRLPKPKARTLRDRGENPAPITRDSTSAVIRDPKPERSAPSPARDPRSGTKPRTQDKPYRGASSTRRDPVKRGEVKQTPSTSVDRGFQSNGELTGLSTSGSDPKPGRSKAAQAQTRRTLKAMIKRLEASVSPDAPSRIRRLLELLKQVK